MRFLIPLLFLTHAWASNAQQWELVTPIKSLSEFADIEMVSDLVGYAFDKPLGAILRTRDGGSTWERLSINLSDAPVAMFMWDEQRGIGVGENGRVYRTSNGFGSYAPSSADPSFGELSCVYFVNDTLGWAGSITGKIIRSTNGGISWTLMDSGQPTNNFITAIQFLDTQTGYSSCAGGEMLKSTDGGQTWLSVGPFDQVITPRDFHFFDHQTGVVVGNAGDVIRTTDGGATWDSIPSNTVHTMRDLEVQGQTIVACGDYGRTIRSTDGGLSWSVIQVGSEDHRSIALTPSGVGLIGSDGRIHRTLDMGASWEQIVEGTWHTRLNKVSFANGDTGVTVGWQTTGGLESGTLRTMDGGRHWQNVGLGGLGIHLSPSGAGSIGAATTVDYFTTITTNQAPNVPIQCNWSLNANVHFIGGGPANGGVYRTTNGGSNWTRVLDDGNITILDLWFVNESLGFAVGEQANGYRTIDGGNTWEVNECDGGPTVFFLNEQLGWARNSRTTDGGDTWTFMSGTPQQTMSIFFTDADTGYAVGVSAETYRSTDGGLTWNTFLPAIIGASVGDATLVDGAIVIGCNRGDVYRSQVRCPMEERVPMIDRVGSFLCTSTSGTVQWFLNGEPIPDGNTQCLETTSAGNYHVIVTEGPGCVSAPSATVQVNSTGVQAVPQAKTRLFPNPASDLVSIERIGNSPALVTVIDAQGRMVGSAHMNGGRVAIDVRELPPGLYLVHVASVAGVECLRLVKE